MAHALANCLDEAVRAAVNVAFVPVRSRGGKSCRSLTVLPAVDISGVLYLIAKKHKACYMHEIVRACVGVMPAPSTPRPFFLVRLDVIGDANVGLCDST